MKSLLRCVLLPLLFLSSCDLQSIPNPIAEGRPADHLIINEVFTLPPSSPAPYSWIELFNPTDMPIYGLSKYTMTFTSHLGPVEGRVTFRLVFTEPATGALVDTLPAGDFLLMYTDSIRFYNHTNLGPGKGYAIQEPIFLQLRFQYGAYVALAETDELVLSDTSGNPIDVVRFGNYLSPVAPDPYPGNQSAGTIPEWSSLSRYAGGYSSGNTANDFYMEAKPIPGWYSELNHP